MTSERPPLIDKLLAVKRRHLMPCLFHFYQAPPVIVRGEMQYLFDADGKRYLDCYSGVGVVSAGHCNPEIVDALCRQARTLQHTTTIYITEPMLRLAERLAALTDGALPRVFFCNSGSEANDGAFLMAKVATGRRTILALENGLHGRTYATMGATALPMWRTDPDPFPRVTFAPGYADPNSVDALEELVRAAPEPPAALIAEPIQGNGGIVPAPAGWFERVREICDRHGMLLIADEVQTGLNRTGRTWALDHHGVRPDILVTAKALGNGQPIAAILTTEAVAEKQTRPGASTYGGNPVSVAAALATLDYHERHDLAARARERGAQLRAGLQSLSEACDVLGAPRGLGLMLGAELQAGGGDESAALADRVLEELKDRGFLLGKTGPGRNVLTFMPPLVVTAGDIDDLLDALAATLKALL